MAKLPDQNDKTLSLIKSTVEYMSKAFSVNDFGNAFQKEIEKIYKPCISIDSLIDCLLKVTFLTYSEQVKIY